MPSLSSNGSQKNLRVEIIFPACLFLPAASPDPIPASLSITGAVKPSSSDSLPCFSPLQPPNPTFNPKKKKKKKKEIEKEEEKRRGREKKKKKENKEGRERGREGKKEAINSTKETFIQERRQILWISFSTEDQVLSRKDGYLKRACLFFFFY